LQIWIRWMVLLRSCWLEGLARTASLIALLATFGLPAVSGVGARGEIFVERRFDQESPEIALGSHR